MQIVAWLARAADCRETRIFAREDLRRLRRDLRFMLVARVAIELQAGRFTPPTHRDSRSNPDLDRRLPRRRFMRHALRGVRIRSLAEARRIFDHIERYIARVARNLRTAVKERGVFRRAVERALAAHAEAVVRAPDTS